MTRQWLAVLGIAIALVGIARESRWIIWGAIVVLAVAFLWRLVAARRARQNAEALPQDAAGRPKA
jgi:hydrogenase-4 membrane subunit HyfE